MRPPFPKRLFISSSPAPRAPLLLLLRCFSSSHNYASLPHSPHYTRRLEDDSRNVRVSVWWDFENCHPPVGVGVSRIAPAITEAVRVNGIKGPIQITAFGDVLQLSKANQEILTCTGIHLSHVPNGGKNSADRALLVDLMYWVSQNPPPAHLFLISGDRDFAGVLHRLRMNNYNVLLATPGKAPDVLRCAATIMWQWPSLLKGEDLTGKRFNHPPDGPYGSWYGNYKMPLEKPFSANEQSASVRNVEICEPTPDSSVAVADQRTVARKVRHILTSYPNGISITDLRAELAKSNVVLDKSLYGYKKFSQLLLAIPRVQLNALGDGNFCVLFNPSGSSKLIEGDNGPSMKSTVKYEDRATPKKNKAEYMEMGHATASKVSGEGKTLASDADETTVMASLHESSSEKVGDEADAQSSETQLPPEDNGVSKSKVDSLKTSCKMLTDSEIVGLEDVGPDISRTHTISENRSAENDYPKVQNDRIENDESGKFIAEDRERPTRKDAGKDESGKFIAEDTERPTRKDAGKDESVKLIAEDTERPIRKDADEDESGKFIAEDIERSIRKDADEVCHNPDSLPAGDTVVDKKPGGSVEAHSRSSTFFGFIRRSWWPFQKRSARSDDLTAHETEVVSHTEEPKISELDNTASHAGEPKLSDEESKLSELDKTVSHAEEQKLSVEEPKLSQLDQTVSHSVQPKLSDLDLTVDHSVKPKLLDVIKNFGHLEKHELFSRGSFWNDMESFVFTRKGSALFSLSKSREDLAHKLLKDGPLFLKSLTEKDILQLVDLLITDKKWLEENPFQAYPFRIIHPVQKSSSVGLPHGANGLRSIFLSRTSESSSQKSCEHDVEKHSQNIPRTKVSKPATETKYVERSTNDMLTDCQKLVNEILREHPDGCNTANFRRLFLERYGYSLEIQKLGYKKLTSLLQTMPGARVESSIIFPSVPAVCDSDQETSILKTQVTGSSHAVSNSDSELSDSASKDDKIDSPWEDELGPVSVNNSNQSDLESLLSQEAKDPDSSRYPDYEPIGSDYDSSESEGEGSCSIQPEEQRKLESDEQGSSLWYTLDLWHNCGEGENSVKKSDNVDGLRNSLNEIFNLSAQPTGVALPNSPSGNNREKQRSRKSYSFVADPLSPEDKLINGSFDCIKKAPQSKMQN